MHKDLYWFIIYVRYFGEVYFKNIRWDFVLIEGGKKGLSKLEIIFFQPKEPLVLSPIKQGKRKPSPKKKKSTINEESNESGSGSGRYFLFNILSNIGFSNNKPSEDDVFKTFQEPFKITFKLLWANHGNNISLAYSGTGDLKSDFVRTEKEL